MTTPIFNFEKTINAALYVAENIKERGFHKIFKILYFADREHLAKYGRPITGDTYIKMDYGPAPSNLYNIFKDIRGDGSFPVENLESYFSIIDEYIVNPEKKSDLSYLSRTDLNELNDSILKYGEMPFEKLTEISHGIAWKLAPFNRKISIENIMKEAGVGDEFIAHISGHMNLQKIMRGK